MIRPVLASLALLTALSTPFLARALASPPLATPGQGAAKLGAAMEELDAAVKSLRAALETPDGIEKSIGEVWKAQRAALDAKSELPKSVVEMGEDKARRKAELAYRAQMQDLLRALLDVETAVLAGDAKKAEKALRQADTLKSAGHSQFRPRDGR